MSTVTYNATWDECIADMAKPPNEGWRRPQSISGDAAFTGSESFEEALGFAISGWDEGRDAMNADVDFATAKQAVFKRPDWEYSVAGQRACIPSYCAGVPNHMVYMDDTTSRLAMPIVRIYVDAGATHFTTAEAMTRRGAAIVALIDQIERAGQRVELIATKHSDTRPAAYDRQEINITVKRADEVLDLDRISFAMAHPSFLRRVCFRIMEHNYPKDVSGYGGVVNMKDVPSDAMYIPPMYGDKGYGDMDKAIATVQGHWQESAAYTEAA